jgi:tetratricopeptide (TPR) repeat protein
MKCQEVENGEIAARYILGQLNEADAIAYEAHFFECRGCLSDLRTAQSLREELRRGNQERPIAISAVRRPRLRAYTWVAVAAAVIVVAGIAWRILRYDTARMIANSPVQYSAPAPRPPEPPPSRATRLVLLARLEPPPYHASNLREGSQPAQAAFRKAMDSYSKKDYAGALPPLEAAAKLDSQSAGPPFFAGVCHLLQNQPDLAITSFERVISLGESPYLEEAHFYRAKAFLRKGDLAGAAGSLDVVVRLKGDLEEEARRLLIQVRELQKGAP